MNVVSSIFLGPLRLSIFFFLIFMLFRLVSSKSSNQKGLNFFFPRYSLLISVAVIFGFVLTLLNAFDLFVIFLILFFVVLFVFMNLRRGKILSKQLRKIYRRIILYTVIKFEKDEFFIDRNNVTKKNQITGTSHLSGLNRRWQLALATTIVILTYTTRHFFFKYDSTTLSETWYKDLGMIKEISSQHWFFHPGSMMGDYALINIYGKLASVSDAIALQSFGLVEVSMLALTLYWVSYKITGRHGPGCIAAFSFGFLYAFLPLNIDQLLQHKSIFLALTVAMPTMIFSINPKALRLKYRVYSRWMTYFFSAILLIDLFVGIYIIPPFLIIAAIFSYRSKKRYVLRALLAYLLALVLVTFVYGIAALINNEDLWGFILSNLFSFTSYTYAPQLIVPFDSLITYYQVGAAIALLLSIFLYFRKQKKWLPTIIFMVYFNLIFQMYRLEGIFLDIDLFTQVISVFLPLFFGLVFYMVVSLMPIVRISVRFNTGFDVALATVIVVVIGYLTIDRLEVVPVTGYSLQDQVFDAYIAIESERLPYSYTVVNLNDNFTMSRGSHYYLSYSFFNVNYLDRDARFNRFRKNPTYLTAHPEVILSPSIFVFLYTDETGDFQGNNIYKLQQEITEKRLVELRQRGRAVNLIYKKPLLEVYEIINEPRSSKINELIF